MPINWEVFDKNVDQAIKESTADVDAELASHISSVTRFTDQEISELFPKPADVKKLADLLKIIKSAENTNNKIAAIEENVEELSGVIFTLVNKLV
jgi:hypothetical protein